ncbi:FAD-binding protein [Alloacidobacterium dinghuense]|uniref:FAD-binding protein n=1 Tax=Alloacidobacterium dinghuense TaxID=2763107 RepID=A0A7G8BQ52_9BACT|nr:FAD-binding protein [Alloacidobacterium dinghuense]
MNKRDFLKTSGILLSGATLSRFVPPEAVEAQSSGTTGPRTNWAGNLTYSTNNLYTPTSVEEVQQVVKRCDKLRALGARHSFNAIADSTANQISLEHLDEMTIDSKAHTVTVGAGVRYGRLAPYLDSQGYALHNLASLPHITVIGACSTATHGSGIHNGNLSTAVSALEFVQADGTLATLSRAKDGDTFNGTVVALGALGVSTRITLDLLPTFQMRQAVYEDLSFDQLQHNLDAIFGSGYSISLFTDWQKHQATQVWIKKRMEPGMSSTLPPEFYGATLATQKLHPITGHDATPCTEQQGIPGPWYERMPHFRMNFTPSSGAELQTEYFVPREHGYEAILAVEKLRDRITPHLFITELRTIAADNLWMSMAYKRDSLAIHFTWKPEWPAVKEILPLIEKQLAPFDPRPHWAKLFTIPPKELEAKYAKLPDFKSLVKQHDPGGKFRNAFLDTNLYTA